MLTRTRSPEKSVSSIPEMVSSGPLAVVGQRRFHPLNTVSSPASRLRLLAGPARLVALRASPSARLPLSRSASRPGVVCPASPASRRVGPRFLTARRVSSGPSSPSAPCGTVAPLRRRLPRSRVIAETPFTSSRRRRPSRASTADPNPLSATPPRRSVNATSARVHAPATRPESHERSSRAVPEPHSPPTDTAAPTSP